MKALRIGTRGSPLALWQAHAVAALLERARTARARSASSGRRAIACRTRRSRKPAARGCSSRRSRTRSLGGAIDLAVHSAKDMSVALPAGLGVAAVLPREDSRDALVLPRGTVTASARRRRSGPAASAAARSSRGRYPGARFLPIRGNVDTRLRKLDAGEYDALVLAVAGLKRLGHAERISVAIAHDECVPAPGQGIVAIETRLDDAGVAACSGRSTMCRTRGMLRGRARGRRGARRRLPAAAGRRGRPRGRPPRDAGDRGVAATARARSGDSARRRRVPAGRARARGWRPSWLTRAPSPS